METHNLEGKRSEIEEMRKNVVLWAKKDRELREELMKYEVLREKQSVRRHNENELREDTKKMDVFESRLREVGTNGSIDLANRIADLRAACDESVIDPTKVVPIVNGMKRSLGRWIKNFAQMRREHGVGSKKWAAGMKDCGYRLRDAQTRMKSHKKRLSVDVKRIKQCEWSEDELCAPTFLPSLEAEMDRLKKDASVLEVMEEVFSRYLHQMEDDRCCPLCCKKLSDGGYHELEVRIDEKRHDLPSMIEKHSGDIETMEERLALARVVSPLAIEVAAVRASIVRDEEILSTQEELREELEKEERRLQQCQQQHAGIQESLSQCESSIPAMESRLNLISEASSADLSRMETVQQESTSAKDIVEKLNSDIIAKQNEYDKVVGIVQTKRAEVDRMKQELEKQRYQQSRRKELEVDIAALEVVISTNVCGQKVLEREYHEFSRKADESRTMCDNLQEKTEKERQRLMKRRHQCESDYQYFHNLLSYHADYFSGKRRSEVKRMLQDVRAIHKELEKAQDRRGLLLSEMVDLQRSIDNEESKRRSIEEKIGLATKTKDLAAAKIEMDGIKENLAILLRDEDGNVLGCDKIEEEFEKEKEMIARNQTELKNKEEQIVERQQKINQENFRDAEERFRKDYIEHYVLADAIEEMKEFKDALDRAQIRFHEVCHASSVSVDFKAGLNEHSF
jgi:DNA repair exonuclease SbcCD ATPase subunit